jgi:hypothetical protein
MVKSKILFFDSERNCRLVKAEIKDGHVMIEDKMFNIDTNEPLLLKDWRSYTPLYILKWDSIEPASNINTKINGVGANDPNEKTKVTRVNPEFRDTEITPEMYRKIMNMKILGNMIKTRKPTEIGGIIMMILGVLAGLVVFYVLKYYHVIKI